MHGPRQRHRQSRRPGVHAPPERGERLRSAGFGARLHDRAHAFEIDRIAARHQRARQQGAGERADRHAREARDASDAADAVVLAHVPASVPIARNDRRPIAQGVAQACAARSRRLVSEAETQAIEERRSTSCAPPACRTISPTMSRALPAIGATPDIARLSAETKRPLDMVAGAYFARARTIGVDRLRLAAERMNLPEHWDRLAVRRLIDDLFVHQRALASRALANGATGDDRQAGTRGGRGLGAGAREQIERVERADHRTRAVGHVHRRAVDAGGESDSRFAELELPTRDSAMFARA